MFPQQPQPDTSSRVLATTNNAATGDGDVLDGGMPGDIIVGGLRLWSKLVVAVGTFVLCMVLFGADGAHGPRSGWNTPQTFANATNVYVQNEVVLNVKEQTWVQIAGVIDGRLAQGSTFWAPGTYVVGADTQLNFFEGSAVPDGLGVGSDAILVLIILPVLALLLILVRGSLRSAHLLGGRGAARVAARLLPAPVREEYLEEWTSWLQDLRADGEPWYRRLVEMMSIVLVAAPRLAVTLRLRSGRAVDR